MLINNSARGPKYSTDTMVDQLTGFMKSRPAATSYEPSKRAAGSLTNFEALYPSLFEVQQGHGVRRALAKAGSKVAAFCGLSRRFKPIARLFSVLALTAVLTPLQANAAFPVYGDGYGYGSSRDVAYSYAYAYAYGEAQSVCSGSFVEDHTISTYTYWSGDQWVSYARVAGMCV
jgi:hypothetical protein